MIIVFVIAYLVAFHFLRKKTRNIIIASITPAILAFLVILPFYEFRFVNWLEEAQEVGNYLIPYGSWIGAGIGLGLGMIAIAAVISEKVRLAIGGWEAGLDPYCFRAIGQAMSSALILYFLVSTTVSITFLLVTCMLAGLFANEYFRSFYTPNMVEPVRPASRLRRFAYMWTGTAGPEEKFYFPSFFYLTGVLAVALVFPDFLLPSLLILMAGDPLATGVGTKLGKRKWPWGKTIEGSLTLLVVCLSVFMGLGYGVFLSLSSAIILMLLESVCTRGIDNLALPLGTSLCLRFLPTLGL